MITRTVKSIVVKGYSMIMVDGQVTTQDFEKELFGDLNEKQIDRRLKDFFSNFMINEITKSEKTYGVELVDFMKIAKEVTRPVSQQKKNGEVATETEK